MKKYYENGGITTIVEKVFVGYGLNAQAVYGKRVTVFSIANGVIKKEYVAPKCFYR